MNPFLRGLLYSGGMTARSSARGPNSDSDDSRASASDDIREATRALNEAITAFSRAVGAAGQGARRSQPPRPPPLDHEHAVRQAQRDVTRGHGCRDAQAFEDLAAGRASRHGEVHCAR